jgi:hypothetical protein
MTITIPDNWKEELEQRAHVAGFSSVDTYVMHVLSWTEPGDSLDDEERAIPAPPADASYVINSRQELEKLLLEGLNSGPPVPVTPEFWADLRRRVSERIAARYPGRS